jgi:hypothetical protein
VVEGTARQVREPERIAAFLDAMNRKYDAGMTTDFLSPDVNGTFAVRPRRVFATTHDDFTGSPTRWAFPIG